MGKAKQAPLLTPNRLWYSYMGSPILGAYKLVDEKKNRPLDTYTLALANISCQAWLMTLFVGEREWRNDACFEQEGAADKRTQTCNFLTFGSSPFFLYPIFRCRFLLDVIVLFCVLLSINKARQGKQRKQAAEEL